jgi:3-oxoacyl-[acyl-carrier protein] reductase
MMRRAGALCPATKPNDDEDAGRRASLSAANAGAIDRRQPTAPKISETEQPSEKQGNTTMPKTPDYFAGKTIVITGAASGIGRATAGIFAREGANVVCADVNAADNERTAQQVVQLGAKSLAVPCDVTQRAAVNDAVAKALDQFGRIHFLFNAAGAAFRRSTFLEIDDDLWNRTFDLNAKGTFYAMQAVLPHMLDHGEGVIVNVASMSVKRGGPGASVHYAASKGAVDTMTMGVAREFASRGIRCISVSPGPIETPFQASANTSPEQMARFLADVPMGRLGQPEEIGELVLFLCSDGCQFMTADTVYANGGGGWR